MEETTGEKISTDFLFLADKLPENKREEFLDYVKYIQTFPGLRLDSFHLGYFDENFKIAEMIPRDKIVIDVGCGFGFQHILYQKHIAWFGIQYFLPFNAPQEPELKIFTDNAKIINGKFENIGKELGITDENKDSFFGVANYSLWQNPNTNEEDIKLFLKLFNHYYYTNEGQVSTIKL